MITFLTGLVAGLVALPLIRTALNVRATRNTDDMPTANALKELVRKGNEEFKRLGLARDETEG